MKRIKNLNYGLFLLFVFLISSAVAQERYEKTRSATDIAQQRTSYEVKQLKLDAKEAKSLGEVNLMYAQQMMALQRQAPTQNKKEEIQALKRSHSLKIKSLISSEKYQEYQALQKKQEQKANKKVKKNKLKNR